MANAGGRREKSFSAMPMRSNSSKGPSITRASAAKEEGQCTIRDSELRI